MTSAEVEPFAIVAASAVMPLGKPLPVSVTSPSQPPVRTIFTVSAADPPGAMMSEDEAVALSAFATEPPPSTEDPPSPPFPFPIPPASPRPEPPLSPVWSLESLEPEQPDDTDAQSANEIMHEITL